MDIQSLLKKARDLREQGKAKMALDIFNEAFFAAEKRKDHPNMVHVFADRSIVFRHLFEETNDVVFAVLARKDAETMLELVKLLGVSEKLHTAYYMLGQAALLFQEYSEAEKYFYKSLKYFKGSQSEKGSWKYHWAGALYKIGEKKKAMLAFASAIELIVKNAPPKDVFLTHVYLSGAYMQLAMVLKKDDRPKARDYYQKAKDIIDADKRLVVRKKQLKHLEQYLVK